MSRGVKDSREPHYGGQYVGRGNPNNGYPPPNYYSQPQYPAYRQPNPMPPQNNYRGNFNGNNRPYNPQQNYKPPQQQQNNNQEPNLFSDAAEGAAGDYVANNASNWMTSLMEFLPALLLKRGGTVDNKGRKKNV